MTCNPIISLMCDDSNNPLIEEWLWLQELNDTRLYVHGTRMWPLTFDLLYAD